MSSHTQELYDRTLLGFWMFLMTDAILFGCLFAAYLVLNVGPTPAQLFSLPISLLQTLLLLTSCLSLGFAMLFLRREKKTQALTSFGLTSLLGLTFLFLQQQELTALVTRGISWKTSGFLSAFFTLVGTHGLHIVFGLLWLILFSVELFFRGITSTVQRRMSCFSLFWYFSTIVWQFTFAIVYLMGGT